MAYSNSELGEMQTQGTKTISKLSAVTLLSPMVKTSMLSSKEHGKEEPKML
jgi:hypothetical protein